MGEARKVYKVLVAKPKGKRPLGDNRKIYSEIRYIFGPDSFFQILFVLLESTHFKAPGNSEKGKWIKWT
jgi:hypothetical protein